MPKTRTASPARSDASVSKSRRNKPRLSRSVCSPGPSTASGRLTSVIDKFTDQNMDSFAFSPLNNRLSVLSDKTDIEEPRRKSWWKNLNENSGNIMEALGDEVMDTNNAFDKIVDIDVVSQEKSNYDFELSDSSIDGSVKSIVLPQRKLFNQNENVSKQKFGQIVGVRENSAKLHNNSTIHHDKTIIAGTKNFFQRSQKPKQVFPAALLNMSHNKTVDKTKENISVSVAESKGTSRNIFGGRANSKNKNIFANFILTESDDEVLDIQPKIFGFQKQTEMQPLIWQDQNSSDELDDKVEQVQTENCKENEDVENVGAEVSNESQDKVADDSKHQSCENSERKDDTDDRNASNNEDGDNDSEDVDNISADDDNHGDNDMDQMNADVDIVNETREEGDNIDDQNVENYENKCIENKLAEVSANQKHNLDSKHKDDTNVEIEINDNKMSEKSVREDEQNNKSTKQSKNVDQSRAETGDVNLTRETNEVNNENVIKNISHEQIILNQRQASNVEDTQTQAVDNEFKECQNLNASNENRDKEMLNQSNKTDNKPKDNEILRIENNDNINCSKENVKQNQTDEVNDEENESESADSKIHQRHNHSKNVVVESSDNRNCTTENVNQQRDLDVDESQKKSDDEGVNQSNILENKDSDNKENYNTSDENLSQGEDAEEVEVTEDQSNDEVDASEEMDYEESENEDEHREHHSIESEDADNNDSHRNSSETDSNQGAATKSKVDISQESDDEPDPEDNEEMEVDSNEEEINDAEEVIEGSPNVSHKTSNSNKNAQPEAVLDGKIGQQESFKAKERNESFRKTKSMYKDVDIRPSLAPARESIGLADGTGSSVEGSGWDSHRTTRKTLRRTFGKDFTPRKSLRALVMEKSVHMKEHLETLHSESVMLPQANSTEYPDFSNQENDDAPIESDHEESRNARLAALDIKLQKIREKNLEKKLKLEEETKNFYKAQSARNVQSLFKIPTRPPPRKITTTNKPKKQQTANIFGIVPPEVIEDMKYKPPKRFKPSNASWITKRLYKFLENKLEQKYDYRARIRAEKLVETVYHFTKDLRRQKVASTDSVKILKHEFARLDIVKTHFEFYEFFQEFMPREVRVKVVPDLVNKIALPRHGVFSDIL